MHRKIDLLVRSGEMESLLLALLSMLILFPVLYLLPIGLTVRGKATVVGMTFSIVVIGLLTTSIIPLWQTILVEGLIIGLSAYFLDKKLANVLYPSKTEQVDMDVFEEDRTKSILDGLGESYSHIASSDKVIQPSRKTELELDSAKTDDKETEWVEEDSTVHELISVTDLIEEVAATVEEASSETKIDNQTEEDGYLGEIEEYLTSEIDSDPGDFLVENEQPLSITEGNISDLELQINETIASLDDLENKSIIQPNYSLEDDLDDELSELNLEMDSFTLEEIETELNQVDTDVIAIQDSTVVFEDDSLEETTTEYLSELEELELDDTPVEPNAFEIEELVIESDTIEIEENEIEEIQLEEIEATKNSDGNSNKVQSNESTESESEEEEDSSFKFEFNFNDDDDDDFWKRLLEDDEEEKKVSTTTDKLERSWERTGLAK